MLYNLTESFSRYSRTVEPFSISDSADAVYQIGSALMSLAASSATDEQNYDIINKLDHCIGTMLTVSNDTKKYSSAQILAIFCFLSVAYFKIS